MSFIVTTLLMFFFWVILSGIFSPLFLISGFLSSLLVAYLSHDLIFDKSPWQKKIRDLGRFTRYLPWLMWQVILANIDLLYRTLHPRLPIDPGIIRFKNECVTELGMVTLANSITLTPGTVTIDITAEEFIIHAIAKGPAEDLMGGEMLSRVKKIGETCV